jgi:hypothetical protein
MINGSDDRYHILAATLLNKGFVVADHTCGYGRLAWAPGHQNKPQKLMAVAPEFFLQLRVLRARHGADHGCHQLGTVGVHELTRPLVENNCFERIGWF